MKPSKARSLRVLNAEKAAKAFKAKTGVDVWPYEAHKG